VTVQARPLGKTCLVLDLDPDLGSKVSKREWESARQVCRATLVHVPAGRWNLSAGIGSDLDEILGLVLVTGVLAREHALADRRSLELLSRGDVLLLPVPDSEAPVPGGRESLTALSQATLIVLGGAFLRAAARWPSLLANVNRRLDAQRARLTVQGLAMHLPRAADRVLLTLWLLADSCGRVTPRGIVVPLDFTHEVLAHLTAARRPTVTLALGELQSTGCVARDDGGHLILTERARREVLAIFETDGGPAIGDSLSLRTLRSQVSTNGQGPGA
jgi:CRP-like cAMP-binding protein